MTSSIQQKKRYAVVIDVDTNRNYIRNQIRIVNEDENGEEVQMDNTSTHILASYDITMCNGSHAYPNATAADIAAADIAAKAAADIAAADIAAKAAADKAAADIAAKAAAEKKWQDMGFAGGFGKNRNKTPKRNTSRKLRR